MLACTPVGRIVYTLNALPAAVPVNYVLDGDYIVIRTAPGSKLSAVAGNAVVAFEVDHIDPATRSGWSVLVVGRSTHETDPSMVDHLDSLGLDSWMPDMRPHYIRIHCTRVTGRRLGAHHPDGAP